MQKVDARKKKGEKRKGGKGKGKKEKGKKEKWLLATVKSRATSATSITLKSLLMSKAFFMANA